MKTFVFNTILVHVARTWERIRLEQSFEEMPEDNIESVDSIVEIADTILRDVVIQKFINATELTREGFWERNTKEGFSDSYIEALARNIIEKDYI